MSEKKPTIEELEALLNSGGEVPFEITPSGEIIARPTAADLSREILLRIPSQIEIAEALHSVPSGPHRETIGRMATALDCLRDGGWEFVEKAPKIERLADLQAERDALAVEVERLHGLILYANPEIPDPVNPEDADL